MKIKRKEYNTNESGLDRIYKFDLFLIYHFDNNNPEKNIGGITDFFTKAAIKAKEHGIEEWDVVPGYDEGDSENLPYHELIARGYRLERDDEYQRRLEHRKASLKISHDNWKRMEAYYASEEHNNKMKEMETIIENLKKNSGF